MKTACRSISLPCGLLSDVICNCSGPLTVPSGTLSQPTVSCGERGVGGARAPPTLGEAPDWPSPLFRLHLLQGQSLQRGLGWRKPACTYQASELSIKSLGNFRLLQRQGLYDGKAGRGKLPGRCSRVLRNGHVVLLSPGVKRLCRLETSDVIVAPSTSKVPF